MRKIKFAQDQYYHVYNRGVEKRDIFIDRKDYERFLYLLFACNDTAPLLNSQFHYRGLASIDTYKRQRDVITDICCFCLMPNHFHILLRERVENGISTFMQKFGTAYTMYFNAKRERSGVLFQGTFKAVYIDQESYFRHLIRYIHLNPAELREPAWKEKGIKDWKTTYEFVKNYPWSSYGDYLGKNRFSKILDPKFSSLMDLSIGQQEKFMKEWLTKDAQIISGYSID